MPAGGGWQLAHSGRQASGLERRSFFLALSLASSSGFSLLPICCPVTAVSIAALADLMSSYSCCSISSSPSASRRRFSSTWRQVMSPAVAAAAAAAAKEAGSKSVDDSVSEMRG